MHYTRWRKNGDPLIVRRRGDRGSVEHRFWAKVQIQPGNCWLWHGARDRLGYGRLDVNGKTILAHRWAYEYFIGPIVDGWELDHLCRNPSCVRFDHLEPVPHQINMQRGEGFSGQNFRKTHCPQGHPYSGDNLLIRGGTRQCRICKNASNRRSHARKVARERVA